MPTRQANGYRETEQIFEQAPHCHTDRAPRKRLPTTNRRPTSSDAARLTPTSLAVTSRVLDRRVGVGALKLMLEGGELPFSLLDLPLGAVLLVALGLDTAGGVIDGEATESFGLGPGRGGAGAGSATPHTACSSTQRREHLCCDKVPVVRPAGPVEDSESH